MTTAEKATPPAALAGDTVNRRSRRRSIVQGALSLVLVLAIFVGVLPRVADFSEVWAHVRQMTWLEVVTLVALAFWNVTSYCLVLVPSLPGLSFGQAMVVTQSSTAVANTLPAGAGVGVGVTWAMYSSWGFPRTAITLSLLTSGVWNTFAKLALPVLALAALVAQGDVTFARLAAAVAGVATLLLAVGVFALMLRSQPVAEGVGRTAERAVNAVRRAVGRPPVQGWAEGAADFRARTIDLVGRRWAALTAGTVVSHLSLFLVLLITLRHVGISEQEVSTAEALAGFAFVRLISALPITPGGLGVVELGLTAALVAAGGEEAAVVAAVLVYRALTYLLPVPLGAAAYLFWRRRSGWRRAPAADGGPAYGSSSTP